MQYLFVHIPKTAGVSTLHYFRNNHKVVKVVSHEPTYVNNYIDVTKLNIKHKVIDYDKYFSFTFVRNPYTRVLSAYNFFYNNENMARCKQVHEKMFGKYQISDDPNENFFAFLKDIDIHKKTIVHFVPQYEFITKNDKILVNFVGKLENYENDMNKIFPDYENQNIILNKSIQTIKELSVEAKKIIYNSYKKDFEIFSYNE